MIGQTTDAEMTRLKPQIILSTEDFASLSALARAAMHKMPELADGLSEELERADIVDNGEQPRPSCLYGLRSRISRRHDRQNSKRDARLSGTSRHFQGKISVLTPVGTALIGLRAGHSITWDTRTGETRRLTVLKVGRG